MTESEGSGDDSGQPRPASLADKLNRLFATIRPPGRPAYSNEEVARSIRDSEDDLSISAQYLWLLRSGRRDNPTKRHIEAIARFFDVSPAYFFDDEAGRRVAAQLETVAAIRDARVRAVALRAASLSPASLDAVRQMIDAVGRLEQVGTRDEGSSEEGADDAAEDEADRPG